MSGTTEKKSLFCKAAIPFFENGALSVRPLSIFVLFVFAVILLFNVAGRDGQQFVDLAKSFLHLKPYFITSVPHHDTVIFGGHQYWPLGPLPAIFLMPFVGIFSLFGHEFYQGYLQFFLSIGIFFLVFRLALLKGFQRGEAEYFACAFLFGSMYLAISFLPIYGFFAHAVTVFLILLALVEYSGRRRYGVIGCIMALVVAARLTAGIGIIFFIFDILFLSAQNVKDKTRSLSALLIPFCISVFLLGVYNAVRFGSFFEQGYSLQTLIIPDLFRSREYGLMSMIFLPANLYHAFIAAPLPLFRDHLTSVLQFPYVRPNPWGMSMFVTSPYLVYLFFSRFRDRISKYLLITCALVAAPIFLYYGVGYWQFGYRYALDFFPFLFLLFLVEYHKRNNVVSRGMRHLIVISCIVNLYLFLSLVLYAG